MYKFLIFLDFPVKIIKNAKKHESSKSKKVFDDHSEKQIYSFSLFNALLVFDLLKWLKYNDLANQYSFVHLYLTILDGDRSRLLHLIRLAIKVLICS